MFTDNASKNTEPRDLSTVQILMEEIKFMRPILDCLGYSNEEGTVALETFVYEIEINALANMVEKSPADIKETFSGFEGNEKLSDKDVEAIRQLVNSAKFNSNDIVEFYRDAVDFVIGGFLSDVVSVIGPSLVKKIKQIIEERKTEKRNFAIKLLDKDKTNG